MMRPDLLVLQEPIRDINRSVNYMPRVSCQTDPHVRTHVYLILFHIARVPTVWQIRPHSRILQS